ncbi:MAG: protein kinase [Magnetococcales bacterium]|nr:protein kinase [Magnetococcales bacterium]
MIRADKEQIAIGSQLQSYRIDGVLGQGGFGITYRGVDISDNRAVAIKEYFPRSMAIRDPDGSVHPKSDGEEDKRMFAWGLERFRKEILTLAKFTHDNIVPILYFFETLGTVYMVMPFVEGDSLKAHVKKNRGMSEEKLLNIVVPLLGGLEVMHKVGFLHRDIKPDNIFIQHHNNQPLLLDFGATRQAMGVDKNAAMTVVMTPEYAPMEQGHADASKQGPWTDIFSMGAVMYWAVTEIKPISANMRATAMLSQEPDPLPPVAQVAKGQYSERVLKAIDHAIRIAANDRPQTIADWRDEMLGTQGLSPSMRNLSGRVAQMAGRRPLPTIDRASLRSAVPPPPRASEAPAAVPEATPAPTEAAPPPENSSASVVQPSVVTPAGRGIPLQRPAFATRGVAPTTAGGAPLRPPLMANRQPLGNRNEAEEAPTNTTATPTIAPGPQAAPAAQNDRFVDNNDGTVIDRKYRLMGLKNVKCFGRKSWSEALSAVRDLASGACGLADGSHSGDWRLPTKDELPILAEWKESGAFPGVPPFDDFWSRDVNPDNTANAWFVGIDSGKVDQGAKWIENRFWPVRTFRR